VTISAVVRIARIKLRRRRKIFSSRLSQYQMMRSVFKNGAVDIGSVDLIKCITLQLVFSPASWVRSVGYALL
jgi:hypothetical protein